MELKALRHLLAVAEHRSFSRAAEAVHLTQPALSRSIQTLEHQAGGPLLVRLRGAIEPTELGRVVLEHARRMDLAARDLKRDLALTLTGDLGELRVGVGPFGGAALVGPVLGRLSLRHPRLRLHITVAPWQELPERARHREVDLIVGEISQVMRLDDFDTQALSTHPAWLVCRSGHPLARKRKLTAQDLMAYPQAGPALPPAIEHALKQHMAPALNEGSWLRIECDSAPVLKDILRHSDAVSMMPGFMFEHESHAKELVALTRLNLGIEARFGAAWLKQRPPSAAASQFMALLAEHDQRNAHAKPVR